MAVSHIKYLDHARVLIDNLIFPWNYFFAFPYSLYPEIYSRKIWSRNSKNEQSCKGLKVPIHQRVCSSSTPRSLKRSVCGTWFFQLFFFSWSRAYWCKKNFNIHFQCYEQFCDKLFLQISILNKILFAFLFQILILTHNHFHKRNFLWDVRL